MRYGIKGALLVFAVVLAAAPAQAQADELNGTFRYVPEQSDSVEDAIDAAIDDMNFLVRGIARRRLESSTEPAERVTIQHGPDEVRVETPAANPTVTPPDGTAVGWDRDGETLQVSTRWDGDALVQRFEAEDGTRTNAYTLDADRDSLTLRVTIESPRLPQPVEYDLVYERVEG